MSKPSIRETFEKGQGILRLVPNFVPRRFSQAGQRLRLHPDDYFALGTQRGSIKERWFSSVIAAMNGPLAPADEGMSCGLRGIVAQACSNGYTTAGGAFWLDRRMRSNHLGIGFSPASSRAKTALSLCFANSLGSDFPLSHDCQARNDTSSRRAACSCVKPALRLSDLISSFTGRPPHV